MSVAGYSDLPLAHKVTLMKICDSADDRNRLGFPGLDAARVWTGLSKSRSLAVLKDLQDWGIVMQVERGNRGRRAVFKAFPEAGDEVFSLAVKEGRPCPGADRFGGVPPIPTDEQIVERLAQLDQPAPRKGPADRTLSNGSYPQDPIDPEGSYEQDPSTGLGPAGRTQSKGSRPQDPIPANGSRPQDPSEPKGSCGTPERVLPDPGKGPAGRTPSLTTYRTTTSKTLTSADADGATTPSNGKTDRDERFDRFWDGYPRKVGLPAARKAWRAAMRRRDDPEAIVAAAVQYRDDCRRTRRQTQYVPHPATWLNDARYNDDPGQVIPEQDAAAPRAPMRQPANGMREPGMAERYEHGSLFGSPPTAAAGGSRS